MKQVHLIGVILVLALFSCQNDLMEDQKLLETNSMLTVKEAVVITFDEPSEGYMAGDIISSTMPDGCGGEVRIYAENPEANPGVNAAMIFDSNAPTGGDIDLGTPNIQYGGPGESEDSENGFEPTNDTAQNNVLIITEDFDSEDPDDSYVAGSYFEFDFSGYGNGEVNMTSFLMIDLDGESKADGTFVKLYDKDDALIFEKEIMPMNDNGVQTVDLENTPGVVKMVLELNNSGAIDDIRFHCERELEDVSCETLFAKGADALCFNNTEPDNFSRWGWTNMLSEGDSGTMELWAGAAQCNTGKGTLVGYLNYSYLEGTLEVEYEMMNGFYLTETHFYAGTDMYPEKMGTPTVAPGQYPYKNEKLDYASSDSYTVGGLDGDIYLIAHAEVCGEFEKYDDDNHYYDDDEDGN
ncbi:hypothetical protein [Robertkochia flava]|uniref:hypothetical protein n=1 Tax=Robertkochia flava TaxID=3447986 RepID=UPI001CCA70A7|nr:hypothetical protein [Robertkochia marina]